MLSYPSGMTVSSRALTMLAEALRRAPQPARDPVAQALRRPPGPAGGGLPAQGRDLRRSGLRVRDRHLDRLPLRARGASTLLAAMAPTLAQAIEVARRKAFVILDGTLLRIDRVGMASGATGRSTPGSTRRTA